jgi:hypothetical protein
MGKGICKMIILSIIIIYIILDCLYDYLKSEQDELYRFENILKIRQWNYFALKQLYEYENDYLK